MEVSGTSVLEFHIPAWPGCPQGACNVTMQWKLGRSADFSLRAFTSIHGHMATSECSVLGAGAQQWALFAITSYNEVVSLCPLSGSLQPVRSIRRQSQREKDTKWQGIAVDTQGSIWLQAQSDNGAELQRLTLGGRLN